MYIMVNKYVCMYILYIYIIDCVDILHVIESNIKVICQIGGLNA